ncbi:MAG TPA: hypothetical protein VFH47_04965 [Candidatus Thermoplasmatota archaeon]|nr:hypothetical protein [Candidatus Thermoplasmatota archaeon]
MAFRSTSRRIAALLVLAALFASALPASGSSPSGPPTYVTQVFYGVDRTVDFTHGFAPLGAFDYVGDDEGPVQSCVYVSSPDDERTNVPTCWADRESGRSKSRVHMRTFEEQYRDPDARAGVGFRYELVPRCDGQQWDGNHPMKVTMHYDRAVGVAKQGGGVAFAEVWGNALRGRGYEGPADSMQPPQPVDPAMVNTRLGLWESTTDLALAPAPPAVLEVVPGSPGVYDAMVYSRTHGTVAGAATDAMAHAQVDLDLTAIRFDWTDDVPPTIDETSWQPSFVPPVSSDGVQWWTTQSPVLKIRGDDDFSCPDRIHWQARPGTNVPYAGWFFSDKTGGIHFDGEGLYHGDVWITDGQGNPSAQVLEVKVGVDLARPSIAVETVPAEPDGENGWFVTRPTLRFTCLDAGSGCTGLRWWTGGLDPREQVASFARTPGTPAVVEAGPLPEGHSHLWSCTAYDFAGWWSSCSTGINVDLTPPETRFQCSTAGPDGPWLYCQSPRWHNVDTWLRVACRDPNMGYSETAARHRVDGGDWQDGAGPLAFPLAAGGHSVEGECRDRAGHASTASFELAPDTEAPPAPAVTERSGRTWFAVGERPVLDFPVSDFSGIKEYRIAVNGAHQRTVTTPSVEMWTANEGEQRVEVRAVDNAGNVGQPGSITYRFDGTFPRGSLTSPYRGAVYINGQSFTPSNPLSSAVSVGSPVPLSVHAWDQESGLSWAHITGAKVAPTWQDLGELKRCTAMPCSTTYRPAGPTTAAQFREYAQKYHFTAKAQDNVGHVSQYAGTDVEYLALVAGGAKTAAGIPYVNADWLKYEGGDFVRYEVHRGLTADFQPSLATKLATFSSADSTSFRDKTAVVDTLYFYKVQLVTSSDAATSNAYPARVSSGLTEPDRVDYMDRKMAMSS